MPQPLLNLKKEYTILKPLINQLDTYHPLLSKMPWITPPSHQVPRAIDTFLGYQLGSKWLATVTSVLAQLVSIKPGELGDEITALFEDYQRYLDSRYLLESTLRLDKCFEEFSQDASALEQNINVFERFGKQVANISKHVPKDKKIDEKFESYKRVYKQLSDLYFSSSDTDIKRSLSVILESEDFRIAEKAARFCHDFSVILVEYNFDEAKRNRETLKSKQKELEKFAVLNEECTDNSFKQNARLRYFKSAERLLELAPTVIHLNSTERNSEVWRTKEKFKEVLEKKDEILEMFQKIREIEENHLNGKFTNFKSLKKIYDLAGEIRNPIDWKAVNGSMDRFYESTYQNNSVLQEIRNLTSLLANMDMDQVSLKGTVACLDDLDGRFKKFEQWEEPIPPKEPWLTSFLVLYASLTLLFLGSAYFMIRTSRTPKPKRRLTPEDRKNDPDWKVTRDNREFWPQLIQASRLPINERDPDGYTKLFLAVWFVEYEEAERLIKAGAAIDASCGPDSTTALHIAAQRGDRRMVDLLLANGADPRCLDGEGRSAKRVCSKENFTKAAFATNYEARKKQVIPSGIKRDFYVLIVDRCMFPEDDLGLLPNNMEVVCGYRSEYDLNDFTHFCMRPRSDGFKDLEIDLDNLLAFEILSKPGMIVSTEWLSSCIDNITNLDFDYYFLLTDITFEKKTHPGAITRIKNDIHRLRPPLLHECQLTILPTNNRIMKTDRVDWQRIIEGFGGTHTRDPQPATPTRLPLHLSKEQWAEPYYGDQMDKIVKEKARREKRKAAKNMMMDIHIPLAELRAQRKREEEEEKRLFERKYPVYSSIVLYFSDSVLLERWTLPGNHITVVGMGWLPESIVRYSLIRSDHRVLRNEMKEKYLTVIYEQGSDRKRYD
uniref:BRCT domain-containing protein n=1 Tax=Caenorhabditis tropicalis TaxID=1561998 RepID=A0A1I7UKX2_9PELO